MARKSKAEAAMTRERILDAAERLFLRLGLDGTSLHHVAITAGVTRGAIYWHFPDKQVLYSVVVERVTAPFAYPFAAVDDSGGGDAVQGLNDYIFGILDRIAADPRARAILEIGYARLSQGSENAPGYGKSLVGLNTWTDQIRRRLADASEQGRIHSDIDPGTLSIGIWIMLDGLIRAWLQDPLEFDLRRQGQCLIGPYLRGLGPNPWDGAPSARRTTRIEPEPAYPTLPPRAQAPLAALAI
jgi:TetR/AcrR family acrAB operon transcriptional repressor